ncbi:YbaK/EbsC family protein [Jiangella aurantiaca]|uniref:YbaK/EbsC family protein n=1 Tax=Jiangella aurantiaca TaxID=2530373 RepID=UPI00193DDFBD
MIGRLATEPALSRPDLLAGPVKSAIEGSGAAGSVFVAPIDPSLADTSEFCAAYDVSPAESANCVVVAGKREGVERVAACMVLATTRADVNGVVRKLLGVRKASFLPMSSAVESTGMEYGGITPLGLPADWPILVDPAVAALPFAVVGSGVRGSKLAIRGAVLAAWPGAQVVEGLGRPVQRG